VHGHPGTHPRAVGAENYELSLYAEHEREDEHILIEELE